MSPTRMLVLGVVRMMQPVHGYDVRRELVSWRLEEMANVKPGSIYSALRTLEKDGCIAVHSYESGDRFPGRTTYVLTGEGEKEFQLLLRSAWWTVTAPTEPLIPALTLMLFLGREELISALQARLGRLEGEVEANSYVRRSIQDGATGADGSIPEHVREVIDYWLMRIRAEIDWTKGFQKRLREGTYRFSGEDDLPVPGPAKGIER